MYLRHMRPGRDLRTLLLNSLALMKQGRPKREAMAIALNPAGYRPANTPLRTPTSSS